MHVLHCDSCLRVIKPKETPFVVWIKEGETQEDIEKYANESLLGALEEIGYKTYEKKNSRRRDYIYMEICKECKEKIQNTIYKTQKVRSEKQEELDSISKAEFFPTKNKSTLNLPNIYFVGKAGSGKTTASNYLISKYGYIASKFAYPVYNLAKNYFGMKKKDRLLLQNIGTDIARETINKNIWINRFKEDIKIVEKTYRALYGKEVKFVSDDVRFPNEYRLLKKMGWIGIYLDSPDGVRIKRLRKRDGDAQESTLSHSSEIEIEKFSNKLLKIDSSMTVKDTRFQIDEIIKKYRKEE